MRKKWNTGNGIFKCNCCGTGFYIDGLFNLDDYNDTWVCSSCYNFRLKRILKLRRCKLFNEKYENDELNPDEQQKNFLEIDLEVFSIWIFRNIKSGEKGLF